MKTFARIIVLVVALTAVQALAVQVTQVSLNYENGATVARVTADGPFQFSHLTEIPKDGKGDRMILDLIGATTGLSVKNFTELPKCGITSIRTAQYAVTPEKVVRVVFDLTKAPVYQVEKQGNNVKITFTDKAVSAFASWNSDAVIKSSAPAPAPKQTPAVAQVTPKTTIPSSTAALERSSSVDHDRLTSLIDNNEPTPKASVMTVPVSAPASAPASQAKVVATENKPTEPTTVKTLQQPTTVVSNQTPVSTPPPAPTALPVSPAIVVVANSQATATPAPSLTPTPVKAVAVESPKTSTAPESTPAPAKTVVVDATRPVTPSVPATTTSAAVKPVTPTPTVANKPATPNVDATPKQTAPAPTPTQPTAVTPTPTVASATQIQQATSAKPSVPPASEKPTVVATSAEKSAPQTTVVAQNNTPQSAAAPKPASTPDGKPVAEAPKVVGTVPVALTPVPLKPAENSIKPATAVKIPNALADNSSEQIAEGDKSEIANPDLPANNKATSRFRRSSAADAKIKGTMVAEFPQRLVVKYEPMGNRDPFATLIDDSRTYNSPVQNRVPNIDGLRLVGIIESDRGASDNRALFEDKNGYSYILSSGDKVQRGYVLRVEDDRVYFQIFEYGWSRTVALAIENAN